MLSEAERRFSVGVETHVPKHSSFLRPSFNHSSTSRMCELSRKRLRVNLSLHWGLGTLT